MSFARRFMPKLEFLRGRKTDYQVTFSTPAGKRALADLAVFCRAAETCGVPGDRDKTFTLIGRNEVWLRIQQHLGLTGEQLLGLYDARSVAAAPVQEDGDE
jgi:hypothetical protein